MKSAPKILVTGAAGFIGSHTCELLLAAGCRVFGVDNFRTGRRENIQGALLSPYFTFHGADVSDPEMTEALVSEASPDAIIHLAALVSVQESLADPDLNFRLNILATHAVAEAARRQRVGRIVFASSAAVYGGNADFPLGESSRCEPLSPYGAAKLASEELLLGCARAHGLTAICLRYFNVFGPRQDPASPYAGAISAFTHCFMKGRAATVFGDGRQSRDFVSVHDVARANVLAATTPGLTPAVMNICTGRQTSLLQVLRALANHYPRLKAPAFADARPGDIIHSVGNPAAAARILGFSPEWTVESGLRELALGQARPSTWTERLRLASASSRGRRPQAAQLA